MCASGSDVYHLPETRKVGVRFPPCQQKYHVNISLQIRIWADVVDPNTEKIQLSLETAMNMKIVAVCPMPSEIQEGIKSFFLLYMFCYE